MKTVYENSMEVLTDLIKINNDRVEGYEKAAKETKDEDADLRALFESMAAESRRFVRELEDHVDQWDHEDSNDTTFKGKIYRAWMDVKATFSGHDRKSILAACEFGEDAAQKAYAEALEDDLSPDIRKMVSNQKNDLKFSHDRIRDLRDMQS